MVPSALAVNYVVQVASTLYCVALVVATVQQARHIAADRNHVHDGGSADVARRTSGITVALFVVAVMMLAGSSPRFRRGRSSLFREGG